MPAPRQRVPGAPWLLPGPPQRSVAYGDVAVPVTSAPAVAPAPSVPTPAYATEWVWPPQPPYGVPTAIRIPTLNPYLTFTALSSDHSPMTVQIQYSSAADFSGPTTTTFTSVPSDVNQSVQVGPFTNGVTRYFRMRAGDGAVTWSDWNVGDNITFDSSVGNAHGYMYENAGVGSDLVALRDNHTYQYENTGILDIVLRDNHAYQYEGDVNTTTPTPHIWFIKPNSGRSGDGFTIYGHGFGNPQSQFAGVLQFLEGATWTVVGVSSWTLVAADANAYTSARVLDTSIPLIDAEHNEVVVTIPSGLVPPGYLLRIETNGP